MATMACAAFELARAGNSTVKGAEFSSRYYTRVRVLGVKITLLEKGGKSTGSGFLSYRKVRVLAVL